MTDAYEHDLTSDEVNTGDEGPTVVVRDLQRKDFVQYAGASGDFNPIHYDESYAREAGNDSVFAQGMLTAGFGAHMVADWFGLENITRYSVRFQLRVFPGDTVTVTGKITDIEDTTVEVDIEATADDGVVLTGSATADLPK